MTSANSATVRPVDTVFGRIRRLFGRRMEQERELRLVAEQAAADERARIARELHDVVAHSVSVMVVQASGVRRLLKEEQHRERDALLSVEQIGRQALTEMRRMLGVMRTDGDQVPSLTPQPGLQHLERLIAQVEEAGLPVTLRVEGRRPELPPGIDLSAYRIVQEGLTNALKHSRGSHAEAKDEQERQEADQGDRHRQAEICQGRPPSPQCAHDREAEAPAPHRREPPPRCASRPAPRAAPATRTPRARMPAP